MLKATVNAQGSSVIAYNSCTGRSSENICSSSGCDALRNKERQDETQFTTKIDGFSEFSVLVWY
jgi:hypothetical protein